MARLYIVINTFNAFRVELQSLRDQGNYVFLQQQRGTLMNLV